MFRKLAVFLFVMLLAIPALADDVSTKYITVDLPDNLISEDVIFAGMSGSC